MAQQRIQQFVLKMLRGLEESTDKQVNNIRKTAQEQNEKFNKGIEKIKKKQTKILELKNSIESFKNTLGQVEVS